MPSSQRKRRRPDPAPRQIATRSKLPPCAGPKLEAFDDGQTPIKWFQRLDIDPPGSQACVFKVQIGPKFYALKIFKYFDPVPAYVDIQPFIKGPPIDLDTLRWHADPFFAECRAYGRIQEVEARAKRSSKQIAAKCYGFIESSENDHRLDSFVESQQVDLEYPQGARKTGRDREANPLRAIVKELIEGEPGVPRTKFGAKTLLGRIRALNKMGVYNGDIRAANIKNGLLLDFGLARTDPHCIFHERLSEGEVDGMRHEDLANFDEMIEEEEIKTKIVALPLRDYHYCEKLRHLKGPR